MTKAFLETPQFFMLLQPTDKCAKNVPNFLQKDYKLLHGVKIEKNISMCFLKNIFRNTNHTLPAARQPKADSGKMPFPAAALPVKKQTGKIRRFFRFAIKNKISAE